MTFDIATGAAGLEKGIERLCAEAEKAVKEDFNYIILSDRSADETQVPIPSLLGRVGSTQPPDIETAACADGYCRRNRRGPRGHALCPLARLWSQRRQSLYGFCRY